MARAYPPKSRYAAGFRRASACALCASAIAISGAVPAAAQDASAASVTRLLADSRIVKNGDLDFGTIIPGSAGGTITIEPNGTVSTTGSVVQAGGSPQPASFTASRRILLDYPTYQGPDGSDTIQLTNLADPTETMTLRDFTTDFNRTIFFGLPAYFFTTSYDFRVAGTLDVAPNQASGSYRGFFTVTVEYN